MLSLPTPNLVISRVEVDQERDQARFYQMGTSRTGARSTSSWTCQTYWRSCHPARFGLGPRIQECDAPCIIRTGPVDIRIQNEADWMALILRSAEQARKAIQFYLDVELPPV